MVCFLAYIKYFCYFCSRKRPHVPFFEIEIGCKGTTKNPNTQIKTLLFCYLQDFAKVASGECPRQAESEVQQKIEKYKLFREKT